MYLGINNYMIEENKKVEGLDTALHEGELAISGNTSIHFAGDVNIIWDGYSYSIKNKYPNFIRRLLQWVIFGTSYKKG